VELFNLRSGSPKQQSFRRFWGPVILRKGDGLALIEREIGHARARRGWAGSGQK